MDEKGFKIFEVFTSVGELYKQNLQLFLLRDDSTGTKQH